MGYDKIEPGEKPGLMFYIIIVLVGFLILAPIAVVLCKLTS
jgi:hypothetical protein